MINRVFQFITSLRLTVVCLCLGLILVFVGTLAQVKLGIFAAQAKYFHSLFVFWNVPGTSWKIPVLPGGYLLGAVLLVNLIGAHIRRFRFTRKKVGIFMIHAGLILLLLGQLVTDHFQVESAMRLTEGQGKNYSVDQRDNELAVVDQTDPSYDTVVAIPESTVARRDEIQNAALPFTLRVKKYYRNSTLSLRGPMVATEPPPATQGVGTRLEVKGLPSTTKTDERNVPSAVVEVVTPKGSLGTWLVSSLLDEPQTFQYDHHTYDLAMRFARHYKPYTITLLDFTHEKYKGTDIPKNFASRIRLDRPDTHEDREVKIYMNNPLRYWGETYYQGSYDPNDDRVSILQVVRNPGWVTPYVACSMVGLGLVVQFMSHLIGFAKKRRKA